MSLFLIQNGVSLAGEPPRQLCAEEACLGLGWFYYLWALGYFCDHCRRLQREVVQQPGRVQLRANPLRAVPRPAPTQTAVKGSRLPRVPTHATAHPPYGDRVLAGAGMPVAQDTRSCLNVLQSRMPVNPVPGARPRRSTARAAAVCKGRRRARESICGCRRGGTPLQPTATAGRRVRRASRMGWLAGGLQLAAS